METHLHIGTNKGNSFAYQKKTKETYLHMGTNNGNSFAFRKRVIGTNNGIRFQQLGKKLKRKL